MSKKVLHKDRYKFKKGDKIHLDSIYNVSGIGDEYGQWWDHIEDGGDDLIVTRDIEFTITFYT